MREFAIIVTNENMFFDEKKKEKDYLPTTTPIRRNKR